MTRDDKRPSSESAAEPAMRSDEDILQQFLSYAGRAASGFSCPFHTPTPDEWSEVAQIVIVCPEKLSLKPHSYQALDYILQNLPNQCRDDQCRDAARTIRRAADAWVRTHWSIFEENFRNRAINLFKNNRCDPSAFKNFIDQWENLKTDTDFLNMVLEAFACDPSNADEKVGMLRVLPGSLREAKVVLAVIARCDVRCYASQKFGSLVAEWAGETVWGQLQHLIWRTGATVDSKQTTLTDVPSAIGEAATHLEELGLTVGHARPSFPLSELSAETRAAWRRSLRATVEGKADLRAAVTEALLWFGQLRDDRAILFTVLELHPDDLCEAMEPFHDHPAGLVRLRVKSVLDLANGKPDAAELLRIPRRPRIAASLAGESSRACTWIGDPRIEELIKVGLARPVQEFGNEVVRTRDSGEETHVAILFERLRFAFCTITDRLAKLAAETDANDRLAIKLEHRIVGKHEEGGPGVGSDRFSADVCLIFEARNTGEEPFARRASLLQAKRLHRRGYIDFYPVDHSQMEDLARQTMASFLLLIGPESEGVTVPVIPARLFLDQVERGKLGNQISPPDAARIAKSFVEWLVQDVIGLWTGDWSTSIVERAKGSEGREPYLLVTISAEILPKGPDGWSR